MEYPPEFKQLCIEMVDEHKADLFKGLIDGLEFMRSGIMQFKQSGKMGVQNSVLGGVLVCSTFGKSRSASFVIAYLMLYHRMSLSNAMAFVKLKRSVVNPNSSFQL